MKLLRTAALCLVLPVFISCEQVPSVGDESPELPEDAGDPSLSLVALSVSSLPETIYYARGQDFDSSGLLVEGKFINEMGVESSRPLNGPEDENPEYELLLLPPDMNLPGPKRVELRAGELSAAFPVLVSASDSVLESVTVTPPPGGLVLYLGESLNTAALDVRGIFKDKDKNTEEKKLGLFSVSGYDKEKRGVQAGTVSVNGKTAWFPLTVKVPASAKVSIATVVGTSLIFSGAKLYGHNTAFIKGQDLDMANAKFYVRLASNGTTYALLSGDGINPADATGFDKDKAGMQTVTLTLDDLKVPVEAYVTDIEPEVYFDYGFWRTPTEPTGMRHGMEGYHTVPGRPVVLSPVRVLIGYDRDNNDIGVSYVWTVSTVSGESPVVSESANKEFLTLTPQSTGRWNVSVTVTGRNFVDGTEISKSADAVVICDPAGTYTGTMDHEVRNFAPGQFTEGGLGAGWSLGTIGGYSYWSVSHRASYTIQGNAFGQGGDGEAGWVEAGIVWFQEDLNGNGLPDEVWYEVYAGTSSKSSVVTRRYSVTFFKADDADSKTNSGYGGQVHRDIYWADCKGRTGVISGGWPWAYGAPNYKGAWVTYTATLVDDDGEIKSENYNYTVPRDGGPYVDHGTDIIPVSRAVAADGSFVNPTAVRFVKVHTGIFKYGSVFGEISTEIASK
ncbi:MAG: hypothetical protein LBD86_06630 [Spirochaetaceae bacterium]|jgi:hypothetical protein|nr:hypothetical protein [Spirochaetaceae bacterium]